MRSRRSAESFSGRLNAFDTVIAETPTAAATVASVGLLRSDMNLVYRKTTLTINRSVPLRLSGRVAATVEDALKAHRIRLDHFERGCTRTDRVEHRS
jgi:hypothetical protein